MDENKTQEEVVEETVEEIVEESVDEHVETVDETTNAQLMELIKAQNDEIVELKKMLSEQFTQTQTEPENEVDAFLNSAKSLTSKILKSFGKEEK